MASNTPDSGSFISYHQLEMTEDEYYEAHKDEIEAAGKKELLAYKIYVGLSVGGGMIFGVYQALQQPT